MRILLILYMAYKEMCGLMGLYSNFTLTMLKVVYEKNMCEIKNKLNELIP